MSGPRFVPLTCPHCGDNLFGRAADPVACCPPCGTAWLVTGPEPVPLRTLAVTLEPGERGGRRLSLPFWVSPGAAVPAFESARPLTLARAASRHADGWPARPGIPDPPPLGARLDPEAARRVAGLAGLEPRGAGWALLAVPARLDGTRLHVAGLDLPCHAEDVSEAAALLARLAERSAAAVR